jgi:hypothetical protein
MVTPSQKVPLPSTPGPKSPAQRVLEEGAQLARDAAREAGVAANVTPSNKTFLRALVSGKLDGVKVGGRWLTSSAAIRRWIEASQGRREAILPALDPASADEILAAHGLGREAGR